MQVKKALPPNYEAIKLAGFGGDEHAIYTYGDTCYTLTEREIPEDILAHEEQHSKQQGNNPDAYIHQWLTDKDFRRESEVEAYAVQLNFLKKQQGAKIAYALLPEMAKNLASASYKLGLTYHQAETLIRHKAKEVVK